MAASFSFEDHRACRGLTESLGLALDGLSPGRGRKLKAGQVLYRRGDPTEVAFLVLSGRLRASAPGRLESFGPGELLGELCFCRVHERQEDAEAVVASEVAAVSPQHLLAAVRRSEETARELLESLCSRLGRARALAGEGQLAPARVRVARVLLELALAEGVETGPGARTLTRRPLQADLARVALISREKATKVLTELREAGAVEYGRAGPLRVQVERLRALAAG